MADQYIQYIVNYINNTRTDGGPWMTRQFGSYEEAIGFIEREKTNKDNKGFSLVKQTSIVTRERLDIGS